MAALIFWSPPQRTCERCRELRSFAAGGSASFAILPECQSSLLGYAAPDRKLDTSILFSLATIKSILGRLIDKPLVYQVNKIYLPDVMVFGVGAVVD